MFFFVFKDLKNTVYMNIKITLKSFKRFNSVSLVRKGNFTADKNWTHLFCEPTKINEKNNLHNKLLYFNVKL